MDLVLAATHECSESLASCRTLLHADKRRQSPHSPSVCKQVRLDKHTHRLHIKGYKLCFTAPRRHSTKELSEAANLKPGAASLLPRCSLTPMGKHTYRLPLGHSAQAAARRRHSTQDSSQAAANRSRRSAASPQTGQAWRLLGERGERIPSRDSPARTRLQSRLRQACLQEVFRPPQAGHMWPSARPLAESGECTRPGTLCTHATRSGYSKTPIKVHAGWSFSSCASLGWQLGQRGLVPRSHTFPTPLVQSQPRACLYQCAMPLSVPGRVCAGPQASKAF